MCSLRAEFMFIQDIAICGSSLNDLATVLYCYFLSFGTYPASVKSLKNLKTLNKSLRFEGCIFLCLRTKRGRYLLRWIPSDPQIENSSVYRIQQNRCLPLFIWRQRKIRPSKRRDLCKVLRFLRLFKKQAMDKVQNMGNSNLWFFWKVTKRVSKLEGGAWVKYNEQLKYTRRIISRCQFP
jgi:hypothetical protein